MFLKVGLLAKKSSMLVTKDWNADITAFDEDESHMIMFADVLSDGIIKQFPEKFK